MVITERGCCNRRVDVTGSGKKIRGFCPEPTNRVLPNVAGSVNDGDGESPRGQPRPCRA